jgi:hypothetical protein
MQTFAVSSLLAFFYGAIGATSTASSLANRRERAAAARIADAMFLPTPLLLCFLARYVL